VHARLNVRIGPANAALEINTGADPEGATAAQCRAPDCRQLWRLPWTQGMANQFDQFWWRQFSSGSRRRIALIDIGGHAEMLGMRSRHCNSRCCVHAFDDCVPIVSVLLNVRPLCRAYGMMKITRLRYRLPRLRPVMQGKINNVAPSITGSTLYGCRLRRMTAFPTFPLGTQCKR
jgi:hypothetical protein